MSNCRFDHIHLRSPDPIKTAQFYETMFGARIVKTQQIHEDTLVRLDLNGQLLLISLPHPEGDPRLLNAEIQHRYGLEHFGLITDNLEKTVDDLKSKGIKFVQEITPILPTTKVSFFLAPENVLVELLSRSSS